jgi:hypothetical protein
LMIMHACFSQFISATSTLLYINSTLENNVWFLTDENTPLTATVTASSGYTI